MSKVWRRPSTFEQGRSSPILLSPLGLSLIRAFRLVRPPTAFALESISEHVRRRMSSCIVELQFLNGRRRSAHLTLWSNFHRETVISAAIRWFRLCAKNLVDVSPHAFFG